MISELLVLIGAIALAYCTAPSPQLNVCSIQSEVKNDEVLEKNLCFVNRKFTAYKAKESCKSFGMSMYQPQSSAGSRAALVSFGKTVLGGSKKAAVFVGTRSGNRCQTATGAGRLNFVSCSLTLSFLCEFQSVVTEIVSDPLPCDKVDVYGYDYLEQYGLTATDYSCSYQNNPITKKTVSIYSSNDAIPKEDIKQLVLDNSHMSDPGSMYLPIELAKNFPNLATIMAVNNQIVEVTKENLQGLFNVQYMDLSHNRIPALLSEAFAGVPNLKKIYLREFFEVCNEKINFNSKNIFPDNNPLTTISADFFSVTLSKLNSLTIYNCECIDTNSLEDNASIKLLPQSVANTCTIV